MAKVSNDDLQPNPFKTYRDPKTGAWIVIKPSSVSALQSRNNQAKYNAKLSRPQNLDY